MINEPDERDEDEREDEGPEPDDDDDEKGIEDAENAYEREVDEYFGGPSKPLKPRTPLPSAALEWLERHGGWDEGDDDE